MTLQDHKDPSERQGGGSESEEMLRAEAEVRQCRVTIGRWVTCKSRKDKKTLL